MANLLSKLPASLILVVLALSVCSAQEVIPLYDGNIPGSRPVPDEEYFSDDHSVVYQVSRPTLTLYLPEKENATGTAVIICPGGGYHALVIDREGYDMAKRFTRLGITAFVLKYRLPNDRTMIDKSIGPLQDAQQALKMVRLKAEKWHIDPGKVGIMGFSAGGHLASTAGTHFNCPYIDNGEKINLRPDFMILVYPVISMTDRIGHSGSRDNLLGANPPEAAISRFSNEMQVTARTPPAFLVLAEDDSVVKAENSLQFYRALHRYHIPVALHLYQKGGHGFLEYPPRDVWMNDLVYWMRINQWIK